MTAMIVETPRCIHCGKTSKLTLEVGKLTRYWAGEHVQNIWPEKPASWREMLITGTHPKCWDTMFGKDE